MTEAQRKEHHAYFHKKAIEAGWFDAASEVRWPEDSEARARMARALFGFSLVHGLDAEFLTWRDRAENRASDSRFTPGSTADEVDRYWRDGLATFTEEQRLFLYQVIDDVLDSAAYHFCMTLDRFEMGELRVLHRAEGIDREVQIHPHGHLEMFQEFLDWQQRFGRGEEIERPT